MNPELSSNVNKVRIVTLYIQHRDGVPEEDRRRLYQHARLSLAEQDAVNALIHLGTRVNRVGQSTFSTDKNNVKNIDLQVASDKDTKKRLKQKMSNDEEYELSRYKPLLRTVLEVCNFFYYDGYGFTALVLGPRCREVGKYSLSLC